MFCTSFLIKMYFINVPRRDAKERNRKMNKRKTINIIISLLCVTAIIVSVFSVTQISVAAKTLYSGTDGSCKWTINSDGLLKIVRSASSGTGQMKDHTASSHPSFYKYRSSVKSVTVGDSVSKIGAYSFYGLTTATKITIGKAVAKIGTAAFYHTDKLKAFSVSSSNASFKTPDSGILYTKDGKTLVAFPSNKAWTSYEIPSSIVSVKSYSFGYNQNLTKVTQNQGSVKSINGHAFINCAALKKVYIKNNCTSLGNKVFYGSTKLELVRIPPSVTTIGTNLFSDTSAMTALWVECDAPSVAYNYVKKYGYRQRTFGEWTFTVKFNAEGGTVSKNSQTVTYGKTYGSLPTPAKEGYSFTGWYLSNQQIKAGSIVSVPSGHTLNARYAGRVYQIRLEPNGGLCGTENISVTFGNKIGSLPEASREGYTFLGWYSENDNKIYTDTVFNDISLNTIYAKWKIIEKEQPKVISQVSGLKIAYKTKNSVRLTWDKQNDVSGYEVYRNTNGKGYLLDDIVTANTMTIKLSAKDSYKFKVRAFLTTEQNTKYGAFSAVVKRAKTFVKKPTLKKTFKKKSGLFRVKWKKITNAKKYQIYQYKNKKWKKVKTTTATSFFLYTRANKTYRFKVRACTSVLGHTYYSKFAKCAQIA